MVDNLEILRASARRRSARLREVISELPEGRGSTLASLLSFLLDRHDLALSTLDRQAAAQRLNDSALGLISRKYERLLPQLEGVHRILATYRSSIGRTDLPVGFQHLIDVLIGDILGGEADPIVHVQERNMYSTADLVTAMSRYFNGAQMEAMYTGGRPVAFNLPGLDPTNALLTPVLAHEVSHTAVRSGLMAELQQALDSEALARLLFSALHAEGVAEADLSRVGKEWTQQLQGWLAESLCDAVALALCGPSFLLAFTAFAPPSGEPRVGTHPPQRDRIGLHVRQLEGAGWWPFMEERLPVLSPWFKQVSTTVPLAHTPLEGFLRDGLQLASADLIAVALRHVTTPLAAESAPAVSEAAGSFIDGIPAVETQEQRVLTPWEIVLSAWIAILAAGEQPDQPASEVELELAVANQKFSLLVLKALEMASVLASWRA